MKKVAAATHKTQPRERKKPESEREERFLCGQSSPLKERKHKKRTAKAKLAVRERDGLRNQRNIIGKKTFLGKFP